MIEEHGEVSARGTRGSNQLHLTTKRQQRAKREKRATRMKHRMGKRK